MMKEYISNIYYNLKEAELVDHIAMKNTLNIEELKSFELGGTKVWAQPDLVMATTLRLGTWPICLTHQSGGGFESEAWTAAYDKYVQKWGD